MFLIQRKTFIIRRTKYPNTNVSRLVLQANVFVIPLKLGLLVENKDVVGAY